MTRKMNKKITLVSAIFFIVSALFAVGCATPQIKQVNKKDFSDRLSFLINGVTTREEVLLKLGEPSGKFEGEHILTYMLSIDKDKRLRVLPRQLALSYIDPRIYALDRMICSLVLVFDENNILEKTGLISSENEL